MADGTEYKAAEVAKMLEANGWASGPAKDRAQQIVRMAGSDSYARELIGAAIRETNPQVETIVVPYPGEPPVVAGSTTTTGPQPTIPGTTTTTGPGPTTTVPNVPRRPSVQPVQEPPAAQETQAPPRGLSSIYDDVDLTRPMPFGRSNFVDGGRGGRTNAPPPASMSPLPRFWSAQAGLSAMVGTIQSIVNPPTGGNNRGRGGTAPLTQTSPLTPMGQRGMFENMDSAYEQDAMMLWDINPDDPTSNPAMYATDPNGQGAGGVHERNKPGRSMLMQLVAGANSKLDLVQRALKLEMEDPDALMQLQAEMQLNGLLPLGEEGFITWGVMDGTTIDALGAMATGKAARPNLSWNQFVDQNQAIADAEVENALDAARIEQQQKLNDMAEALSKTLTLNLTSGDAIKNNAQELARSLTGASMTPDVLDQFVNSIHGREREMFWNDPSVRQAQAEMDQLRDDITAGYGAPKDELNRFMSAIETIESSGNPNAVNKHSGAFGLFQFMPGTWAQEAKRFGLDPTDKSAANQRRVASAAMSRYHAMFGGDWRKVAIAWYAGEKSPAIKTGGTNRTEKNGYISIAGYADKAVKLMGTSAASRVGAGAAAAAGAGMAGMAMPATGIEELQNQVFPSLSVQEVEGFDRDAYLKNLVMEKGGVDVDAYRYLQTAQSFSDLLKGI